MVGNSSSGIIEAASFRLPVINIGDRQGGRLHGANVIDVPERANAIVAAVRKIDTAAFKRKLARVKNPYGDGAATERIVSVLRRAALDKKLIMKRFYDL
jgi:UDP-N-acetylglucosamine 2-epimerase